MCMGGVLEDSYLHNSPEAGWNPLLDSVHMCPGKTEQMGEPVWPAEEES